MSRNFRIAQEVLDTQYIIRGEGHMDLELLPQESITDIESSMEKRKKPIRFVSI